MSISNDEIRRAVWHCGNDKSPGPDGFTFEFFRCNSSFVALIPKINDPKLVSDYRPISLIGSIYKVVTKVLANRLSTVISDIISDVQSAFLPNRQILDGPFIISELISWCKRKKQQAMMFKVDFAKAYDSVRWDYLDDVLRCFGFGPKWRSWISGSLNSVWVRLSIIVTSILVNGSPTAEFPFHCGLNQGDPLAPFLFILIMESLHLSFARVVEAGLFKGIQIGSSLSISHLFYADDAVFIGEWSDNNLSHIMQILHSRNLGCLVMSTPFNYLGVMVGGNMSLTNSWNAVIGKLKSRLSNWSKVLAAKDKGGLGVSSLYALNRALLFKWVWRFLSKDNSVWSRLISSIHGDNFSNVAASHSSLWKTISREILSIKSQGIDLISHCRIRVDNGSSTKFWKDPWIGDKPLFQCFPRMYALENSKDCYVAAKLTGLLLGSFRRIDGNISVLSPLCPVCSNAHEDISHLLFNCDLASDISRLICRWWDLFWSPLSSYSEWLSWFKNIRLQSKSKDLLEGVFYIAWWSIWNFRNQLLFSAKIPRKDVIFDDIVARSFTWCHSRPRRTIQVLKYNMAGVKRHLSLSLANTQEGMPRGQVRKHKEMMGFDCFPIIEGMYGLDWRERVEQGMDLEASDDDYK
ncbi:RNA-directed DNA polymerase, eukaryota [Tanacetum coccineum]